MKILILEDDERRKIEMTRCIPSYLEYHFERRADKFIEYLSQRAFEIDCISLDHDLEKENYNETDPGDGRDVVNWICENSIKVPILIHTTNAVMGDSMYYNLIDNGNIIDRIDPYDDLDWIMKSWINKVLKLLNK